MSGPYASWQYGAWPPDASAIFGLQIVDLYVRASGSDGNPGTQAAPLRTLDGVDARIPQVLNAVYRVHVRNETYAMPSRGYWLRSRLYGTPGAKIKVFADEAWDPTVYTIGPSGAAAAGTGAAKVVTAGLVVDAHQGKSIRMTSGAAAGQYRRINANTVTDLLLDWPMSPAPAPGDTFQVFTLNATLESQSGGGGGAFEYMITGDQLGAGQSQSPVFQAFDFLAPTTGVVFQGVRFTSPALVGFAALGAGQVYMMGCDCVSTAIYKLGGQWIMGFDREQPLLRGWGAQFTGGVANAPNVFSGGQITGYLHTLSDGEGLNVDPTSSAWLFGGFLKRIFGGAQGKLIVQGGSSTPLLIAPGGVGSVALLLQDPNAVCQLLSGCNIQGGGAGIQVKNGAQLQLGSGVTGASTAGLAVFVDGASTVRCIGAPAFGGAGNDWTVFGAAAFNKAALAALNSFVLGTDGSLATRAL